jgi:flagellar basal-body rod protein FlgB
MKIDEPVLTRMSSYLDFTAKKQQVISSNLANSETPGYRSKDVSFDQFLADAQSSTPGHLKTSKPEHMAGRPHLIRQDADSLKAGDSLGYDQNNVDLEKEMVDLAENVMKFSVMGRLVQLKLQLIKSSIREGR